MTFCLVQCHIYWLVNQNIKVKEKKGEEKKSADYFQIGFYINLYYREGCLKKIKE